MIRSTEKYPPRRRSCQVSGGRLEPQPALLRRLGRDLLQLVGCIRCPSNAAFGAVLIEPALLRQAEGGWRSIFTGWRRTPSHNLLPMKTIRIDRAPVLTLWASVAAERLGWPHDTALTLDVPSLV